MTEINKKEIMNELIENYGFFYLGDVTTSLWNNESSLLQLDEDEKKLILEMIEVDKENRRMGKGTEIMSLLCNLADKYNKEIRLIINDSETPERILVKFYSNFGFKYNDDQDIYIRKSRAYK